MSAITYYQPDLLYTDNQRLDAHVLGIQDGWIHSVTPAGQLPESARPHVRRLPQTAIIPGLVNSHNHSFQALLKGICDDTDFFTWRDQALYRYARQLTTGDLYTGALFAFAEMIRNGITTVCDFFYIHDQANDNALTILRAARDLGIRITLARTMYDWDGAPKRFQETVDQAVDNTRALMAATRDDPMVHVLPAPHSLHGASQAMIEAGAALAREHGVLWHMHVAEGQYERRMIMEKTGKSPIGFLHHLGLLDDRMVGIHCVWLDDADIALMAAQGARISYNPTSNMFLGDGVSPIRALWEAGVCISLGTDGGCSNNRASIMDEMRMTTLLQKVTHCDAAVLSAEAAFLMGTVHGGLNLGLPLGKLAPGFAADFVMLDLADLSLQPIQHFGKNLVYSCMPAAIRAVYAGGVCLYENGDLTRVPSAEIVQRVQALHQRWHNT